MLQSFQDCYWAILVLPMPEFSIVMVLCVLSGKILMKKFGCASILSGSWTRNESWLKAPTRDLRETDRPPIPPSVGLID